MKRVIFLITLITMLFGSMTANSQSVPKLVSFQFPQYPSHARAARIQGTVKFWFELNSRGDVRRVETTSGHPLLRQAAFNNVKTWKFRAASAAAEKYEAEFVYRLSEGISPTPRVTVSMSDFRQVEVESELENFVDKDGYQQSHYSPDPGKVYFLRCEVDSTEIPCWHVAVELLHDGKFVRPRMFHEGNRQGFFVPRKLRQLRKDETLGIAVTTPTGKFVVSSLHAGYLKGDWELALVHDPFPEEWEYLHKGQRCMGIVEIPWTEPGLIFTGPCSD